MGDRVVVLVDDDKVVLDALRTQLRQGLAPDLACECAESVADALELIDELTEQGHHVVLVVTDWLMPHRRGDELLAMVQKRHPGVFRVMLTGQADVAVLKRIRDEAIAHEILFKPWSRDHLAKALQVALDR